MKLNKRLFGPLDIAADLLMAGRQKHRANSRRVKDMVSQPNKRLGQALWKPTVACPRLRLILPDPTAIRVGLSHASRHSNVWHTAQ